MKRIFPILLLLSSYCHAQNYQCLQSGVKHYFINDNNYLRGIRIDSVIAMGDTTVYYPYKTLRPSFTSYSFDTAGSWLGGKVLQLPDSTFLFDDIWGDNITIKTQAGMGDSWLFYNDTISHIYIASVVSIDTMTVLGVIDSVKDIVIHSYQSGMIDTLDSVNNFSILLSKNNGFVQIFDLYTFPYYSPTGASFGGLSFVSIDHSAFNLIDYVSPTTLNMYNFNVGDLFAGNHMDATTCTASYLVNYIHYDSVIAKVPVDPFHVNYAMRHLQKGTATYVYETGTSSRDFTYDYTDTLYTDTSLVFLTHMPEEYNGASSTVYYYYPADTSFCHLSPAYMSTNPWVFEGCPFQAQFKQGMLPTYDTITCSVAGACSADYIGYTDWVTDIMYYALKDGVSCGGVMLPPLIPSAVNNIIVPGAINIFPNPAQNELAITAPGKIQEISITNRLGQTIFTQKIDAFTVTINVANFSPGIYFIKVNGTEVRKFLKQ